MSTTTIIGDRKTVEIPRETIAELMSRIGGHLQSPPSRREDFYTELETTQVLPTIEPESE